MAEQDECAPRRRQCIDPLQHDDEVMRPMVRCAETAAERSRPTGSERTGVGDQAWRFVLAGLAGLRDRRTEAREPQAAVSPAAMAQYILDGTQLYPPLHRRELARIVLRTFGDKTNHSTRKRFLEPYDTPIQLAREFPRFAPFADASQARWSVVRMAAAGWNNASIAAWRKRSRSHGYPLLAACERDGFAGLEAQRTRPPQHPDNPLRLPFLNEVCNLQQAYPRAGRFRLHGLLPQQRDAPPPRERTVGRAMASIGRFTGRQTPRSVPAPPDGGRFNQLP